MKGVEFNIVLVIIILSVVTLIAVGGYYFATETPIRTYLAPTFTPCGQSEGSLCCNLDNPDLEPFCGGGMECDVRVDTFDNPSEYAESRCVLPEYDFIFMTEQYVYDDSW